jgi:hypothetical protein
VAGSCKHGNEPSGSIKDGAFYEYLRALLDSQERLYSTEIFMKHSDAEQYNHGQRALFKKQWNLVGLAHSFMFSKSHGLFNIPAHGNGFRNRYLYSTEGEVVEARKV